MLEKISVRPITPQKAMLNNQEEKNQKPRQLTFGQNKLDEDEFENKEQKGDPLMKNPLRLCAYSNEVGAALSPIPGIGPVLFAASWVPALMYFGADIYDKYAKGMNEDYSHPSKEKAFNQSVFQALASVVLPTAAVMFGQNVASKISGFLSKSKLEISQKEEILDELRRYPAQKKLSGQRHAINEILAKNPKIGIEELKQTDKIKKLKNAFVESVCEDIKAKTEVIKHHSENTKPYKKILEIFAHSKNGCENLSQIKPEKFDTVVKPYLKEQLESLLDTRIELQRAMNPDGSFNEHAAKIDKKLLSTIKNIVDKNKQNPDVLDKGSYAVREALLGLLQQKGMKLSVPKIIGGFTSLILLAAPIDYAVHHLIVSKLEQRAKDKFENNQ